MTSPQAEVAQVPQPPKAPPAAPPRWPKRCLIAGLVVILLTLLAVGLSALGMYAGTGGAGISIDPPDKARLLTHSLQLGMYASLAAFLTLPVGLSGVIAGVIGMVVHREARTRAARAS